MTTPSTALATTSGLSTHTADSFLSGQKLQMLGDTIMKDATPEELQFFGEVCNRTNLDPFRKQIHAVQRWDSKAKRMIWSFQTGVDGFRAIAHRTGQCAGIDDVIFNPEDESTEFPKSAKVTVYRLVAGQRVPFTATARWSEYVQTTKDGHVTSMWRKLPYSQLGKCFDTKTEVLTDHGFKLFADVTAVDRIAAVRADGSGLDFVEAPPFSQPYLGPMVSYDSDMVDFLVTPHHDMVTNLGKMEARALLALASSKSELRIPLRLPDPLQFSAKQDQMKLIGYILADGTRTASGKWIVSVGKSRKIHALEKLEMHQSKHTRHSKGKIVTVATREVKSNFDRTVFLFSAPFDALTQQKTLSVEFLRSLQPEDAKILLDAWQEFDGYTNRTTGLRRIYATDPERVSQIEVLAVLAGYSISKRYERTSDLSDRPNIYFTLSETEDMPVKKWKNNPKAPSISEVGYEGLVWCVTVPSGMIVVRRNGFSMICGNCAECLALRKAFPEALSGLHSDEEMAQAANPEPKPVSTYKLDELEQPAAAVDVEVVPEPAKPTGTLPTLAVHESVAPFTGGRWKAFNIGEGKTLGQLKSAALMRYREQLPETLRAPLLATYIDQILALLEKAGTTEDAFATLAADSPDIDLEYPVDLWRHPALFPDLLTLAQSIES